MEANSERFGKLERRPAREGWRNEPSDFTPWLADHLDVLGGELSLALTLQGREHPVGRYFLDLLLQDGRGRVVIAENQFEGTDHDHLGKLLTYCAGTKAEVAIWIAESFTDEHVAALQWLNDNTNVGIGFYGVELELLQIGEERAPHFNVRVRPNEWVQRQRQAVAGRSEWSWERYQNELRTPARRLEVGQQVLEALEKAISERELPWQARYRKGYVSIQRPGDHTVLVVDLGIRAGVGLKVKLPDELNALGIPNPFPDLDVRWFAANKEWAWFVPAVEQIPDVGKAVDLAVRFNATA
jgi:hypothetical protein